jgi:beta-glucosidase
MVQPPPGTPLTEMDWETHTEGLYDVVARVNAEYGSIPIYITENGGAFADRV